MRQGTLVSTQPGISRSQHVLDERGHICIEIGVGSLFEQLDGPGVPVVPNQDLSGFQARLPEEVGFGPDLEKDLNRALPVSCIALGKGQFKAGDVRFGLVRQLLDQ